MTVAHLAVKTIDGSVTAPAGFRSAGVACGIKKTGALDLALIASDTTASAAAVFTTNKAQAAPVTVSQQRLRGSSGRARAVAINSGCANACTGPDGHAVLQVSDGSTIEVYPNSKFVFRKNPGNWHDLIDIFLGKVRVHIEHLGTVPNPNRVITPVAVISVRGTTFDVTVNDDDEATTVEVEELCCHFLDCRTRLVTLLRPPLTSREVPSALSSAFLPSMRKVMATESCVLE